MTETQDNLKAVTVAWEQRQARIPARFGSVDGYFQAVDQGLFTKPVDVARLSRQINHMTEPEARRELAELVKEINRAGEVSMPAFKPRKVTCPNNFVVIPSDEQEDDE